MLTKEKIIEQIKSLPDEFSFDDLIERLFFIERIENRVKASNRDEVISEENLSKEMEIWFRSNG